MPTLEFQGRWGHTMCGSSKCLLCEAPEGYQPWAEAGTALDQAEEGEKKGAGRPLPS